MARVGTLLYMPILQLCFSFHLLEGFKDVQSSMGQLLWCGAFFVGTYGVKLAMSKLNPHPSQQIVLEFYCAVFCSIPRQLVLLQLESHSEYWLVQGSYVGLRLLVFSTILTREFQRSLPEELRHPVYLHCNQMKGVSAKAFLEMMVGISVPLYCLCLFAFLRIGYDKRFYPIVVELNHARWVRVVWWLVGAMLLEVLMLVLFKLYHKLHN